MSFKENEEGYKICLAEHVFNQYQYGRTNTMGEYLQITQVYRTGNCERCPLKKNVQRQKGQENVKTEI